MIKSANEYLVELYLDWVNNFVSVGGFAEYHGLSYDDAISLINLGKKYTYPNEDKN